VIAAVLAACSGGGSSSSLTTAEAKQYATKQFTPQDVAAADILTPAAGSFLAGKHTVTNVASTTPSNGDESPYGLVVAPVSAGTIHKGDMLVDNFDNSSSKQGTGTTIVDVNAAGAVSVFALLPRTVPGCPGGVGLDTAMVMLRNGWIIAGSLPTNDGTLATAGAGCLLVLSPAGKLIGPLGGAALDGPWDAAVDDEGNTAQLFVTTTLNGLTAATTGVVNRGTVVRLTLSSTPRTPPTVTASTVLANGLGERQDAAALVKGPTGLALGTDATLFVSDNLGNRILAIPDASSRTSLDPTPVVVSTGGQLAGPLGLVVAPDEDLLVANADNGKVVEITQAGRQVGSYYAVQDVGQDPPGNGDLFDLAISPDGTKLLFVKDDTNVLATVS